MHIYVGLPPLYVQHETCFILLHVSLRTIYLSGDYITGIITVRHMAPLYVQIFQFLNLLRQLQLY